jgi:hypothetical protein
MEKSPATTGDFFLKFAIIIIPEYRLSYLDKASRTQNLSPDKSKSNSYFYRDEKSRYPFSNLL